MKKFLILSLLLFPSIALAQPVASDRIKITDNGAQLLDVTATGAAKVDGSAVTQPVSNAGTFATQVDGAALTALQLIDDMPIAQGAAIASKTGPMCQTSTTSSDPTYVTATVNPLSTDVSGRLRTIMGAWGSGVSTNDGTVGNGTVRVTQAGMVAHDAVDSGNPLKIGFQAISANPTAVATGDRTNAISDLIGRQVTVPYSIPENSYTNCLAADITDTTSTSIKAAGSGSIRHYVTSISIMNSHATVATRVDVLDGSTVIWGCPSAANGGGCTISFPVPLRGTAATALNIKPATTGSAIRACVAGFDAVN